MAVMSLKRCERYDRLLANRLLVHQDRQKGQYIGDTKQRF